ncbi:MAG: putative DNA-binding domain-containing protein [Rhodoferax sp.]|nr:putative DNA-binding domain-containing protein [Rhodoferax sp.]
MSALAEQQQGLLAALFVSGSEVATNLVAIRADFMGIRGLKSYQSNGHGLAQRALAVAYPVVAQLLGDESFGELARALWHAQPPQRGDIACWGDGLPDFVRNNSQLADEPYLADVARLEWALHRCASAADAVLRPDTLALLGTQEPDAVWLQLAPGVAVVRSAWPVASILLAHQPDSGVSLADAGQQLREGVAQDALVWRQGLRPRVRQALAGEVDFVGRLCQGSALGPAMDAAPDLDIQHWLADAVQGGLLLALVSAPDPLQAANPLP